MKLLIVNDEALTANTMRTDIPCNDYGIHEVYTAYSTEGAKKQMKEYPVEIVLCDIEMPGENGLAFLRWCRAQDYSVECIFLTCHAKFDYAKEAIELGCQDYIVIPAKYEDIGKAVLKVVKRIQDRKEELRVYQYGQQAILKEANDSNSMLAEKSNPDALAQKAVEMIMERMGDEELSVNNLAEMLYVHPVYLNRIFKEKTGKTINKYITEGRIQKAAELMKTGKYTLTSIAEQVGYKNYSNFNLMFHRYFHCTPSQYLKERG